MTVLRMVPRGLTRKQQREWWAELKASGETRHKIIQRMLAGDVTLDYLLSIIKKEDAI